MLVDMLTPVPELSDGLLLVLDLTFATLSSHTTILTHEALSRDSKRIDISVRILQFPTSLFFGQIYLSSFQPHIIGFRIVVVIEALAFTCRTVI
jgi:hypothetical protein